MESSKQYNSVPVNDHGVLFAATPIFGVAQSNGVI